MSRLSVIVPGYRTPCDWWRRCLDSVARATTDADEIFCVDDGSPDGAVFLDEKPRTDIRVRVIHRRNAGLAVARNTAMAVCRGKWVTFVDSDDEVLPDVYTRTIDVMEADGADVGLFGLRTIWTAEGLTKVDVPQRHNYGRPVPSDIKALASQCLLNYACNRVYHKAFLDTHRLRFAAKGMPCEDIIFNLECIMAGARWCAVDCIGYVYYRTGMTLLSTYRPFNGDGLRLCSETWRRYIRETPGAEQVFERRSASGEGQYLWAEWDNIWRPRSPHSAIGKLRFLEAHKSLMMKDGRGWQRRLLRLSPMALLLGQTLYQVLRRWVYVRPVRCWHIRRLYPSATRYHTSE